MLSRKYYEKIAFAIRTARDKREVALNLCDYFMEDNPRFNPNRFLEACGFIKGRDY